MSQIENEIKENLKIIARCAKSTKRGIGVFSTYQGSRYPHIYPRDMAAISRSLAMVCTETKMRNKTLRLLGGMAKFMASIQSKSGYWGQRYGINGRDRSIYIQEDCTAHGIITIANYLLTAHKLKKPIKDERKLLSSIAKGLDYAFENHYKKAFNLFYSTTSIHEFSVEQGYTLWVNSAYMHVIRLLKELKRYLKNKKRFEKYSDLKDDFGKAFERAFIQDDQIIARIMEGGVVDNRPDITLLSPFYFDLKEKNRLEKSIELMEKELWDKKYGLVRRYKAEMGNELMHLHAGDGPWIQYSAILAQYYYSIGKKRKGDKIMKLIDSYRTVKGYLPEHIASKESFKEFMKKEWKTGLDFSKEFDSNILLPHVDFDRITEELFLMKRSYYNISDKSKHHKRDFIRFGVPLSWSHAEYIAALIYRKKAGKK